jgi:Ca-activated chloride channel homolog
MQSHNVNRSSQANMSIRNSILGFAVLLFFSALLSLAGEKNKDQGKKPESDSVIRAEVNMVSLPVVVTTKDGRRVMDLKKEDFHVFEDNVEQTIAGFAATDEPVSEVLALDTSGSTELELANIQNASIEFVNTLHPDDSVAIMSFADDVTLQGDFTIDRDRNAYAIKKTRSGGNTAIYEAVWLALEDVLKPVKERRALILFTDGVDTCSRKASEGETLELARETEAPIYCIYYNTEGDQYTRSSRPTIGGILLPGTNPTIFGSPNPGGIGGSSREEYLRGHNYLSKLSEYSGGITLDADETGSLRDAFEKIAKELSSQYSIGYYSTNQKHDGKFRKVTVKLDKPNLVARTRMGYTVRKDKK